MIMKLKNLEDKFDIRFLDEKTKQTDEGFRKIAATMTPVLAHGEFEYQDGDEIAYHLEKHFPDPPLETRDVEANALAGTATPMSSLVGWIKNKSPQREETLSAKFYKSLGEIDHTLGRIKEKGVGPFLCGPELKFPDCILLPKLYHAKVAALFTKGYDITESYPNIASYLKAAQDNAVFRESCPTEKEIQGKWREYKR